MKRSMEARSWKVKEKEMKLNEGNKREICMSVTRNTTNLKSRLKYQVPTEEPKSTKNPGNPKNWSTTHHISPPSKRAVQEIKACGPQTIEQHALHGPNEQGVPKLTQIRDTQPT